MADETFKITIKGTGLSFDQSVDKGVANQVMSFIMTGSPLPGRGAAGSNSDGREASGQPGASASGLDAKQFLALKKPNTLYERIACLGYFLHTERNTTEFAAKELRAINKEAALQPITNLPQRVADTARKYGFISAASGRTKQMTVRGDAVAVALPNREAVKAALDEHPMGNKRKKAAKKKKK